MRRFGVLISALLLATGVAEARAQTVAEVEQAWRGWMDRNGRTTGGLAVLHQGRVAHEAAMGGAGNQLDGALGAAAPKITRWP